MTTTTQRICPLCDDKSDDMECSSCGVPTIATLLFAEKSGSINPGDSIAGRYKVESMLGQGGMGAVYLATQLNVNRPVAVKTLLKDLVSEQKHVVRFYREAQSASQLNHPNIVRVFDFGIDDDSGTPFIVMEYLEGQDLSELVRSEGPMSERRACELLVQVAKALIEAHSKGLVHRDLKPDNIHIRKLQDGDEHCKVLDFGLAKAVSGAQSGSQQSLTGGVILGTPLYMSPEQINRSPDLDFRSDLFALGCILYFMVVGDAPFAGHDNMVVLVKHINEPLPALPEVLSDGQPPSKGLQNLYQTLVSKEPEERAASTAAVSRALSALARGQDADITALLFDGTPSTEILSLARSTGPVVLPPEETLPVNAPELDARQPSPRRWLWVAAVLLLVGGAFVGFSLTGDSTTAESPASAEKAEKVAPSTVPDDSRPSRSAASTPKAAETQAPSKGTSDDKPNEDADKAAAKQAKAPIAKPEPEPEPPVRKQRLDATPIAEVFQGDRSLGTTPVDIQLPPKGETLRLVLRADGYVDQKLILTSESAATAAIALQAIAAPVKTSPAPKAKAAAGKAKKRKAKVKKTPAPAPARKKKIPVW